MICGTDPGVNAMCRSKPQHAKKKVHCGRQNQEIISTFGEDEQFFEKPFTNFARPKE